MAYTFDHEWSEERRRLAQIEHAYDPWTTRTIEALGPQSDWRCLEIGGGGGSIAEWLCERVGPNGCVVATDLETKFLERIDAKNIEVRRHDIVTDALEERHYDLIHARAVLEHLPERDQILLRLANSLRPGGWLLLEAGDFSTLQAIAGEPKERELFRTGFGAVIEVSKALGMDTSYGRRLGESMREAGLEQVRVEGVVLEWSADHPLASLYELTCMRLRDAILEKGLLTPSEFDSFLGLVRSPDSRALSHIFFSACGRRPIG